MKNDKLAKLIAEADRKLRDDMRGRHITPNDSPFMVMLRMADARAARLVNVTPPSTPLMDRLSKQPDWCEAILGPEPGKDA